MQNYDIHIWQILIKKVIYAKFAPEGDPSTEGM